MKNEPTQPRRVIFDGPKSIRFEPAPMPAAAGVGQLLLKTRWTMISTGTELAFYVGYHAGLQVKGNPWAKYPFEPGYAAISEVVDIGSEVTGFRRGQLVFHWGRHASWSAPSPAEEVVLPVPEGVDPRLVLFARFAQISGTAVVRLPVVPESVVVIGAGLIGILAGRMFELAGSKRVVIQDINQKRLDIARAAGLCVQFTGEGDYPHCETPIESPECVIEATGVHGMIGRALSMVATLGTVVMLGSPGGDQLLNLYAQVFAKSVMLVGAHEGRVPVLPVAGRISRKEQNESAIAHLLRGDLNVGPLITAEVPFYEIEKAYRALIEDKDNHLATVVRWNED